MDEFQYGSSYELIKPPGMPKQLYNLVLDMRNPCSMDYALYDDGHQALDEKIIRNLKENFYEILQKFLANFSKISSQIFFIKF